MKPSESSSDVLSVSDCCSESVYECSFCEYQDIDPSTVSYHMCKVHPLLMRKEKCFFKTSKTSRKRKRLESKDNFSPCKKSLHEICGGGEGKSRLIVLNRNEPTKGKYESRNEKMSCLNKFNLNNEDRITSLVKRLNLRMVKKKPQQLKSSPKLTDQELLHIPEV